VAEKLISKNMGERVLSSGEAVTCLQGQITV
jgi:hypothetical protein